MEKVWMPQIRRYRLQYRVRVIQIYKRYKNGIPQKIWDVLNIIYASNNLITRLGVLNFMLNRKLRKRGDMRDRVTLPKTNFAGPGLMEDSIKKLIIVGILISSLSDLSSYAAVSTSINTIRNNKMSAGITSQLFSQKSKKAGIIRYKETSLVGWARGVCRNRS